jgi:endonuclease III
MARSQLSSVVNQLEKFHGKPTKPMFASPLEMILWENVIYLADDKKRQVAFDALRERIGLSAAEILSAPPKALLEVTRLAGILPKQQLDKLRRIAQIVRDEFGGDLNAVLKQPLAQAKRALKKFPAIGEPGAEKILLFCEAHPILALESNGLRVLLRLGFGKEQKNYAASYRSVQEAVGVEIKKECSWLIRAHQLLRIHGQEICRRTKPICEKCPLAETCRFCQQNR